MPASPTETAWQQLHTLAAQWRGRHLREMFAGDPQRFARYNIQLDGLLADFSKHWLDDARSEEHTSELQSRENLVCRLLLEKKKKHLGPPADSNICERRAG